jgi:hypothetical protein
MQVIHQGRQVCAELGTIIHTRWSTLRSTARVRYRGYAKHDLDALVAGLRAGGRVDEVEVEPVTATFVPGMPSAFIELLLLPTAADLQRLRGLVQDPSWWKGTA